MRYQTHMENRASGKRDRCTFRKLGLTILRDVLSSAMFTILLAITFLPATHAQPTQSNWSAELRLKRLGNPPVRYLSGRAFTTRHLEAVQKGQVYIDRGNPSRLFLRVGVFVHFTTDGADVTEGIPPNLAAHDFHQADLKPGDVVLGMDFLQAEVYFSGTRHDDAESVSPSAVAVSGLEWHNTLVTATDSLIVGGLDVNATDSISGRLLSHANGSSYELQLHETNSLQYFRGTWCEPTANQCEIMLGILNVPVANIPSDLDSFTLTWDDNLGRGGTGPELHAIHGHAELQTQTSEPVTYNLCADAACPQAFVSLTEPELHVSEGDSVQSCIRFNSQTPTQNELSIPLLLVTGTGLGMPSSSDIQISNQGLFSIPSGRRTFSDCLTVTAVDNLVDPVDPRAETKTATLQLGTLPNRVVLKSRAGGTAQLLIADNDGPDITVHFDVVGNNHFALEGAGNLEQLVIGITVDLGPSGTTIEESVQFVAQFIPAAGATFADVRIADQVRNDANANLIFQVINTDVPGSYSFTLGAGVRHDENRILVPIIAEDDDEVDPGERVVFQPRFQPGAGARASDSIRSVRAHPHTR